MVFPFWTEDDRSEDLAQAVKAQSELWVARQMFFGQGDKCGVGFEELVDKGKEDRRPVSLGCKTPVEEKVDQSGSSIL